MQIYSIFVFYISHSALFSKVIRAFPEFNLKPAFQSNHQDVYSNCINDEQVKYHKEVLYKTEVQDIT